MAAPMEHWCRYRRRAEGGFRVAGWVRLGTPEQSGRASGGAPQCVQANCGLVLERSFLYPCPMPRPREFEPEKVLDSAMRQFWERGYRATSVDDLVRATGVKPGSLYSAFPGGKHALLMGSLDRYSRLVGPQKLGDLGE